MIAEIITVTLFLVFLLMLYLWMTKVEKEIAKLEDRMARLESRRDR